MPPIGWLRLPAWDGSACDVLVDGFNVGRLQLTLGLCCFCAAYSDLPAIAREVSARLRTSGVDPGGAAMAERQGWKDRAGVTVALGAILGLRSCALTRILGFSRVAAETLIAPAVKSGQRVWYVGHWGFQWYAEKQGRGTSRALRRTPP